MNGDLLSMALSGLLRGKAGQPTAMSPGIAGPVTPFKDWEQDYFSGNVADTAAYPANPGMAANPFQMSTAEMMKMGANMMSPPEEKVPFHPIAGGGPFMAPQNSLMSPQSWMSQRPRMQVRPKAQAGGMGFNPAMLGGGY